MCDIHLLAVFLCVTSQAGGLLLEGCSYDGVCLGENQHDSPSVSAVPTCYLAWVLQVGWLDRRVCWNTCSSVVFSVVHTLLIVSLLAAELCGSQRPSRHHLSAFIRQLREGEGGDPHQLPLRLQPQPMDADRSRPLPQAVKPTSRFPSL